MPSYLLAVLLLGAVVLAAAAPQSPQESRPQDDDEQPKINWGRCPQLEPTEQDKKDKQEVIRKCLEETPAPKEEELNSDNSTLVIEQHRNAIAGCALTLEDWYDEKGQYKYGKAETEIKQKKLASEIEAEILQKHQMCREEATTKFAEAQDIIKQVQLYQACMDFHISNICGIEVVVPQEGPQGPQ